MGPCGQRNNKNNSKTHKAHRAHRLGPLRSFKHHEYAKDMDQIHEQFNSKEARVVNHKKSTNGTQLDADLPGLGQFYCVEQDKYFVNAESMARHKKSKRFKKRTKLLKEEPYSQAEADMAAGLMPADNGIRSKKVESDAMAV